MAAFTGTLDKCKACDKTVYFVDLLSADGATYHKSCFKCSHCKGTLVMSNYSSMDGVLYCKPHFEQLFKESGNFSKNFQTQSKRRRMLWQGHQARFLPCSLEHKINVLPVTKLFTHSRRWQWREDHTTNPASSVHTVAALLHTHHMLLLMEFYTASTIFSSCSWRREITSM